MQENIGKKKKCSSLTLLLTEFVAQETKALPINCHFTKTKNYKEQTWEMNSGYLYWRALLPSARTQSLNFSIRPHPSASTCLCSLLHTEHSHKDAICSVSPSMGPIPSFSSLFLLIKTSFQKRMLEGMMVYNWKNFVLAFIFQMR